MDTSQVAQVLLRTQYQQLRHAGAQQPELIDTEFQCHSQNGEDGILLYLFSVLGSTTRKAVEICAGNGVECNAANLIVNHGWQGLLVDGDRAQIEAGQTYYRNHLNTRFSAPTLVTSWITAETVDNLIAEHGFAGNIDLLSIDVDGMDYWVWLAVRCVQPRVVVLEFNAHLGPEKELTLPYDPEFRLDLHDQPYQSGASLAAFVKLGHEKGYRLIGVESRGVNAFFVRHDIGLDLLPERTPTECFARTERLKAYQPSWLEGMYRNGQHWDEVSESLSSNSFKSDALLREPTRNFGAVQAELAALRGAQVRELTDGLTRLRTELAARHAQVLDLQSKLASSDAQIAASANEVGRLRGVITALETTINTYERSRSWRVTAPLRAVCRLGRATASRFTSSKG